MPRTHNLKHRKKVRRPWGWYCILFRGANFKVKKFSVFPGQSTSLQSHKYRSEHWVVVNGKMEIRKEDKIFTIKKNESAFIPIGCKHRFKNSTRTPIELIEVQNGDYLGEDDIIRYDDKYGRT